MGIFNSARFACILLLLTAVSTVAGAQEGYQKGTIRKGDQVASQSCDLIDGNRGYQIGNCGDFQGGQVVDYRVKDNKLYVRRADGSESRCPITARLSGNLDPNASIVEPPKYQKGTIEGFEIRKDMRISGGGGGGSGTPGTPVSSWTRNAKVYELHGVDLIYKVDYCGAFQAGQFTPGQEVEYRVDQDRVYIRHGQDRHGQNKEYSCQLEGTRKPEPKSDERANAESTPPSSQVSSAPPLPLQSSRLHQLPMERTSKLMATLPETAPPN